MISVIPLIRFVSPPGDQRLNVLEYISELIDIAADDPDTLTLSMRIMQPLKPVSIQSVTSWRQTVSSDLVFIISGHEFKGSSLVS